ncbi:EamA family transporter [Nocardioides sp.]|uniref:EamA family transporter n=1 Tax=Nocardioides sp. TaxID=35761 RepID=UPI003526DFB1
MEDIRRVTLFTMIAPIAWGSTYLVTQTLLPPDRPLFAGLVRALPVGLLLLAWRRELPRGSWWWRAGLLGVLNIGAFFALIFLAAYHLPGGLAATMTAVSPIVVMLLAWWWAAERPRPAGLLGGLVGLVGVALLVREAGFAADPVGVAAALGAVATSAVGFTLVRRWTPPTDLLTFTSWQLVAGGLVLLPVALLVEGAPPEIDGRALVGFAYLGLVGTGLAYLAWFTGVRRLGAGPTALIGLVNPVVGTLLGVAVAGEAFGWSQLAGMAMVLGGVLAGQPAATSMLRSRPRWTRSGTTSADGDRDAVGELALGGVCDAEPVGPRATGLDVGREAAAGDLGGHRERHPLTTVESLHLQDRAVAAGVGAGEVDLLHRRD